MRRRAALIVAAVLATSLSACVQNLPNGAVEWLGQQDGIAEARILTDTTGAWSSGGLVRGELEPDLDDAALTQLIGEVQDYAAETGGVGFWLGVDERDFDVPVQGAPDLALWRDVLEVPGVENSIVSSEGVWLRTLRPDAIAALDAVIALGDQGIRLEAFAQQVELDADYAQDLHSDEVNTSALEYRRPAGCAPAPEVRGFTDTLVERDDIPGATIDLCSGVTLDLPDTASLAEAAVAVRTELDERGLTLFPVQLASQGAGGKRFASVTPGAKSNLAVLEAFEGDAVPPMDYSLSPDGTLAVTAYDVLTADLVTLMQNAPAASRLNGIGLQGSPVAILGPLDALPGLLDDALALDAVSDTFGSVALGAAFGSITLESPVGSDPDAPAAVAALRDSGATEGRAFTVRYLNFEAEIVDGVAALSDDGYVGADALQAFVDAWNSGG